MAAAAAVSALLAGALPAPLLADASSDALRAPLGRQADLLSRLPLLALTGPRGEAVAERHDLEVGVVLPDGQPQGVAAVLTDAELAHTDVELERGVVLEEISMHPHFGRFSEGLIALADIVYFLAVGVIAAALVRLSLDLRRVGG